jgi:hypothetical protein
MRLAGERLPLLIFLPDRKRQRKKCLGFDNFVSEIIIDGKRGRINMLARFFEHLFYLNT